MVREVQTVFVKSQLICSLGSGVQQVNRRHPAITIIVVIIIISSSATLLQVPRLINMLRFFLALCSLLFLLLCWLVQGYLQFRLLPRGGATLGAPSSRFSGNYPRSLSLRPYHPPSHPNSSRGCHDPRGHLQCTKRHQGTLVYTVMFDTWGKFQQGALAYAVTSGMRD